MCDLKFTKKDCDDIVQCLQDAKTTDFEIIPRHGNNFIFKITAQRKTSCFYAKPKSKVPQINPIFEDLTKTFPDFNKNLTPEFYCAKSDLLFFEDLTCQRFQTSEIFALKHIETVLKVLAEFHGTAIAYEQKFSKKLSEVYGLSTEYCKDVDVEDAVWSFVDNKDQLKKFIIDIELKSSKCVKTLCHGNLKKGNMLFHYQHGIPDACKLINFDCVYASPAYDVLQVIFFNTSEEFRLKHLEHCLDYYQNLLNETLDKHHCSLAIDFKLESHILLPIIKFETINVLNNDQAKKEVKEIISFSKVSREDCYVAIKNTIKSTDFDFVSFEVQNFKENCDTFGLKIKIHHLLEDKTIYYTVKCGDLKQEILFYNCFVKSSPTSINNCVPQCYHHRSGLMVLQNLANFSLLSTLESFDFKSSTVLVKKLAHFHASTFILEEKQSEKLKILYRLDEKCFKNQDYDKVKYPDGLNKAKWRAMLENLDFRKVLCHGKLSGENVLIQGENHNIVDCLFINFHLVKYLPPAYDLLSLLYSTKHHLNIEELQQIYHKELAEVLGSYHYNINEFLPYQELVNSIEHLRPRVIFEVLSERNQDQLYKETLLSVFKKCTKNMV